MRIENPLDELLFSATLGVAPTDEDLTDIVVPPGLDADTFRAQVAQTATHIAELRAEGSAGAARQAAEEAAGEYASAFPTPTGKRDGWEDAGFDPVALAQHVKAGDYHRGLSPDHPDHPAVLAAAARAANANANRGV